MVWGLFPVDPLQGEEKYFIFKKGTFKVGRKGCDIIVNKDKGVSRVHAEIIVNSMDASRTRAVENNGSFSDVVIRDCSKYGTFVNKNLEFSGKVHELPSKETSLRDGDIVSFGTGSASYRFCYVPIVCFLCGMDSVAASAIKDQIASIGASITNNLSDECTHILIDEGSEMKECALDAIASKKPLVLSSWAESLAEKSIRNEIPGLNSISTLLVEGLSVKVVDPKTRESCLKDYIFLLGPIGKYKFGNGLQKSVEATGASILAVDEFQANSQGCESGNRRVVFVIPIDCRMDEVTKVGCVSRMRELDLVCAVLSGHLDTASLQSMPVVISSSCSTDETVVADSDVEEEGTSSSVRLLSIPHIEETAVPINQKSTAADRPSPTDEDDHGHTIDHAVGDYNSKIRSDKLDASAEGTSDIIYSQDLIVTRQPKLPSTSSAEATGVNFKRFKKKTVPSGNSFDNLVPFSKFPFKDSVYESEHVEEAAKEEKKRKKLEAMAEELFNNDKGRQRKLAGTLRGIFARS